MIQMEYLQEYWWLLISVLGAVLVFMLFVQGGQTMLCSARGDVERSMMVNSLGRKWELTFTTLVVFGGAFFASFPLFYSTSFGGAYWLWMIILFSFILQAVSYEFRRKPGNLYGTKVYDKFLLVNGLIGCVLLGVAVGTFFFGADFTVTKGNLLDTSSPVISRWTVPTRGLEAVADWRCLLLGLTVLFLARTQASLYFINNTADDEEFTARCRKRVATNGLIFVILFLAFYYWLLTFDGYETRVDGGFERVPYKYFHNYTDMWWCAVMWVVGVVLVLYAIIRTVYDRHFTKGIWFSGIGTVLVVLTLFWVAGYNNTPYYPSMADPASSLTIYNSSSSHFTLETMSWVSLLIPFVLAYIAYVWHSMDRKSITPAEMRGDGHKY
ncbi:MAG: cytochrome d ubiquinol oxidase subunit II [Pseudoflavonifractor sp.]|nr:cytochrome d ubiquinol oxidase subunit II [Pseudoflavonifractor sp.]